MRKALIVGINKYPNAELNGCEKDAIAIANVLDTNGDGSPNFEVRMLLNIEKKENLYEEINNLFAGDCETAIFYFSGHGYINDIGGYIMTPDYS